MTSLPVKMTSYQKTAWSINRFWVELSFKKFFWWFPYHSPHSKVKRTPYFPFFDSEKNKDIDPESVNKPLFLTKSSMENSMSISVFWYFDVWYSCELKISFTIGQIIEPIIFEPPIRIFFLAYSSDGDQHFWAFLLARLIPKIKTCSTTKTVIFKISDLLHIKCTI